MRRLVILGAAGAGKSTQAKCLRDKLDIAVISTGEILRDAIASCGELAEVARPYVDAGELVPDEVMIRVMRLLLRKQDVNSGWILEGYPRTAFQAEELDFLLEELSCPVDRAIYLDLPKALLVERSLARGHTDDTPDVIQRRLELFHERTTPLLDYYRYKQKLIVIDGSDSTELVTSQILKTIH